MHGNKRATPKRSPLTAKELKKIDDYVLGPKDYQEIPEQTDEDFARGILHIGGVPVSRGRPRLKDAKAAVSLRLDADVLAHYRRTGRGWQTRINALLRKAAKLSNGKRKRA